MEIKLEKFSSNQIQWPSTGDWHNITNEIAIHAYLSGWHYGTCYKGITVLGNILTQQITYEISDYGTNLIKEESKDFDSWIAMLERLPVQVIMQRYEITKYGDKI